MKFPGKKKKTITSLPVSFCHHAIANIYRKISKGARTPTMANMLYRHTSRLTYRIPNLHNKFYSKKLDVELPKNVLDDVITAQHQPENGAVYDKRPFRITLEAGKKYSWCLCGRSKKNPFCDGTHRMQELRITLRPVKFAVAETKEYWLCNCKHTNNRPFCDGTHKLPIVQEKTSIVKQ